MTRFIGALPKIITIIIIAAVLIGQWRAGYFRRIAAYAGAVGRKFYLRGILIPVVPLLACIMLLDPALMSAARSWQHPVAAFLGSFGGMLGRNIHPWMFLAFLYCAGLLARRKALSNAAFGACLSAVLAAALSFALKFLFLRARPYGDFGHLSFFNFDGVLKDARVYQSFTSGDVAIVAAIAFFLFKVNAHFSRWFLILLPLCTAFARVYANKHWPSDVFLAVWVGLCSASFIYHYEKDPA
ncbi:MAG: phosphatase PAP2 family protein [Candidatus Omnitrophota bacterium]|nr:phosphatase PAP2 family protein [Candidatus Omnitrophota bacterium]